ncbi:hypothetical protein K4T90_11625 [Staphylococcus epidermidis]|nr:hypothetical protein [Staphylococcus epidermidis]MCG1144445.1 hypothetical protein [Staphylococcus epidermidis]MCG1146684.1 hypothetical protein [Staphylococcus epidermidis]MCG1885274.1 hypothetical protein [Staphylococcus epidermidis]MCG2458920.1 hypothetical protein [Staphylococcus epidermidis]
MVIQANMSPKAVVEVWETTAPIFVKFNVPLSEKSLEIIVEEADTLTDLLTELNAVVGSSSATCIEGG